MSLDWSSLYMCYIHFCMPHVDSLLLLNHKHVIKLLGIAFGSKIYFSDS